MSDTVFKFGAGKACTSIEVAPFTPICSKPAVPGSEALTLEVPAPVFAPVVPPQECACFAFKDGKANVTVTMEAGHGSGSGTASVGIAATGDCCNGAYEVTPTIEITVPECVTADHVIYSNTTDLGYGGSITCTLGIRNCVPYFEMSSVPVSVTLPNIPNLCLGATNIEVKATYIDANGDEQTASSGSVTVSNSVDDHGCQKYSFGTITLDLRDLPTGGFGNGGSVFKASDGDLYLDGTIDVNDDVWYGGGLGNLLTDDPDAVLCRGPKMIGRSVAGLSVSANSPVQYVNENFRLLNDDGTTEAAAWHSSRKATTTTGGVTTTTVDNGTITIAGERGQTGLQYVGGNLSVVLPSGFQWHEKGLALNLSHFFWEKSGLLSVMEETGMAALVSPAPAVFSDDAQAYATGAPRAGAAAGGLRIDPDKDATLKTEPGLYIAAGDGLRVFGLDAKTPSGEGADASGATAAERIGQLEVMYGPGFRVRKANSGTTPQYLDAPVDAAGALVPNEGRGLRVHGVTKTTTAETDNDQKNKLEVYGHSGDFLFNYDGKMVINDQPNASGTVETNTRPVGGNPATLNGKVFTRSADCTIPVVAATYKAGATAADPNTGAYWALNTAGLWQVRTGETANRINDILTKLKYDNNGTLTDIVYLGTDNQYHIASGVGSSTIHINTLLALSQVAQALAQLNNTLGTLCIVNMHYAKSGVLMGLDANENSSAVARHYAASAS